MQYEAQVLDKKSAFYRVVIEDPEFHTPFKMKYIEDAIKSMGGLIANDLGDLLETHKTFKGDLLETHKTFKSLAASFRAGQGMVAQFGENKLLPRLLQHVAFGEQVEAETILKAHSELMLINNRKDVTSCTEECMVHHVTAFEFALWTCDWHMYNMMWNIVEQMPEEQAEQKERYRADLRQQLERFQRGEITATIDNLSASGLRVLEGPNEPTEAQRAAVLQKESYHLILHRDREGNIERCELGFYQTVAQDQYKYGRRELDEESKTMCFLYWTQETKPYLSEMKIILTTFSATKTSWRWPKQRLKN